MLAASLGFMTVTSALGITHAVHDAHQVQQEKALVQRCAPNVSPVTTNALIRQESVGNPMAIHINSGRSSVKAPATLMEAQQTVSRLDAAGVNYDLGLMQVNSSNFKSLGYSSRDLLDPCTNIQAGTKVLNQCYATAVGKYGEGQTALRHALSCYNTGSQSRGLTNGYVGKVVAHANANTELKIPAIEAGSSSNGTRKPVVLKRAGSKATSSKSGSSARDNYDEENQGAFAHADSGAFGNSQGNEGANDDGAAFNTGETAGS